MSDDDVPTAVRLVRDFVNSREPQTGEETWTSVDALRQWLAEQQLADLGAPLDAEDVDVAITVREGLRNVLLAHAGHDADPGAVARLDAALAGVPVRVDFDNGAYRLVSTRSDAVGQALAALLDAVRQSSEDGTWPRLKVCARESCRWAYYDASRNQVRRWCSMAGCGNYVKMRRAAVVRRSRTAGQSSRTTNNR